MRYFVHIGYHGFNYRGWQRQLGVTTVQEVLETAISKIFKTPITIVGCGRTDAQVNASQYFFHFDVNEKWNFDLKFRLNKILPTDIAIFDIIEVEDSQHARFDAVKRTYDYFIHTYKDPFLSTVSSLYFLKNLDYKKMQEAVSLLPKYNNYRTFCKSPDKHNSTICNITAAKLFVDNNGDKLRFQISSNRFLKCMIRILVGKFLEIGKGEFSVEEFEHCLKTQENPKLIIPAHPQGLYLSKVTYPFLDVPARMNFSTILENKTDIVWQEI